MKIRTWTSVLLLVALSGCTGPQYDQKEADLKACEVFRKVASQYSLDVQDFRQIVYDARETMDKVSQNRDSLAFRIDLSLWNQPDDFLNSTALQVLGEYDEEEYEEFVASHTSIVNDCKSLGINVPIDFLANGQPSPKPTVVLDACNANMKSAQTTDSNASERYLKLTAENCDGAFAWYQALKKYPYAMGFPDVVGNELEILCFNYPRSRACTNP